ETTNNGVKTTRKSINKDELISAIKLAGYDTLGFHDDDFKYIKALQGSEDMSLRNIVAKSGLDEFTIKNEIEPFLLKLHLIDISTRGRILNPLVLKKLKEHGLEIPE